MTPSLREQQLEQWLKQQRAPRTSEPTGACLDAELAAAWVEGALSPSALASAHAHVAGCARCQTLMRTMLDLPVEPALAEAVETRVAWWRGWLAWGAPLGAAAAATLALAIWLRVPAPVESSRPVTESARTEVQQEASRPDVRAVAPAPVVAAPEASNNAQQRSAPSRGAAAEPLAARARRAEPPPLEETTAQKSAGTVMPAAPTTESLNRAVADASSVDAARPAPPPPPAAAPVAAAPAVLGLAAAGADSGAFVVSPRAGSARWRVTGARVEDSADAGQTWSPGSMPGVFQLTAGSAVSPATCWLVGRRGVVLVTVDGTTWRKTAFAGTVDLTAVVATSAQAATVVAADGRRFLTGDGGQSWVLQP